MIPKKKKIYSARLCVCIYIHTLIINKFLNIFFFKITNNRINITLSDRIFLPKGVHESGLVLLVFFDFWIICLLIVKLWYFFKIICIYITRTSLWYSILMTPSISKWFDISTQQESYIINIYFRLIKNHFFRYLWIIHHNTDANWHS